MIKKNNVGRGSGNGKQSAYGIKKLRELILDLAVRGKLVPQDPNDEPASKLLEKIEAEKEKLIAEGKIKKQNPLPEITEEEKPFDLPKGWGWVRLEDVSANIHYGYTASAEHSQKGIRLLRITDIQNDKVNWETVPSCDIREKEISTYELENNDLLIARTGGTIGKSYLVNNLNVRSVFASYLIRVQHLKTMYSYFIKAYLGSQLYWSQLYASSMGTGQPNVNGNSLKNLIFPLPPLAEQKRIVEKVNELMALCDRLEEKQNQNQTTHENLVETLLGSLTNSANSAGNKLPAEYNFEKNCRRVSQNFATVFTTEASIEKLKSTILQLAVMGKLVNQDPKDEPASALMVKIAADPSTGLRGRASKKKQLPEIKDEEKPFALPEGWEWVRLNSLGHFAGGGTPSKNKVEYWKGDIPWVSPKDMKTKYIYNSELTISTAGVENSTAKLIPKNSILIVARSGILKRTLPVCINSVECTVNQDIKVIVPYLQSLTTYIWLILTGFENYILNHLVKGGMTVQSLLYSEFEKQPFPLPPLAEQKRIVEKVDELMAICDTLKEKITQNRETAVKLADAVAAFH